MVEAALGLGFEVLVLTNAMLPMQRPRVKSGLLELKDRFPGQLTLARQSRSPHPGHA